MLDGGSRVATSTAATDWAQGLARIDWGLADVDEALGDHAIGLGDQSRDDHGTVTGRLRDVGDHAVGLGRDERVLAIEQTRAAGPG